MHAYSTSTSERQRIPVVIFLISVALAGAAQVTLNRYSASPPWWISFPSIGAFYGAVYFLFDYYLWKWSPLRSVLQVKIPVLHGQWPGFVKPASGESGETRSATLVIDQHWSKIKIALTTDRSESRSNMAAIGEELTSRPSLRYVYDNDPKPGAVDSMHRHSGTAWLTLESRNGDEVLSGGYYTGRDRVSTGELEFRRARRST